MISAFASGEQTEITDIVVCSVELTQDMGIQVALQVRAA